MNVSPKRPHPTRQEWRYNGGMVIHEPRLWLPFIAVRFDGVRLGAFPTWGAARDALAESMGVGPVEMQEAAR
jgi:hypothetical protein